jgi:hypothetical protein
MPQVFLRWSEFLSFCIKVFRALSSAWPWTECFGIWEYQKGILNGNAERLIGKWREAKIQTRSSRSDLLTLNIQNKFNRNVEQTFRILHPNHVTDGAPTAGKVNTMAGLFRIEFK